MQQLYVALGMALAMLLALGHNAVAQTDCYLPDNEEMVSLIEATYTSDVMITLRRNHSVCLASGMYRDKWSSASFLVRYTCTPEENCSRGPEVEKELLDIRCEEGAWMVHAVNATPNATSFDTPLYTNCSSCVSPTEIEESDGVRHCVACNPECHTSGARKCFGPGNDKCCNFYNEEDKCLPACNKVGDNFACTAFPCYESNDCTGRNTSVYSGRECCAQTTSGHSFNFGTTCSKCIVHGFECVNYEVSKGFDLRATFRLNVKGTTRFPTVPKLDGKFNLIPVSNINSTCVFEEIDTKRGSISYPTTCLEAGDELEMKFDSIVTNTFISQVERHLEFIRDTANVTVVQAVGVGLEKTFYDVSSDMDEVEVCTVLNTTHDSCECQPRSPFNFTLTVKDYSKVVIFPDCGTTHCVNLSIEDDLRVTSTQRVNIKLNSTDIAVTQKTDGMIAIDRPGALLQAGFEMTAYSVLESVGYQEVCVWLGDCRQLETRVVVTVSDLTENDHQDGRMDYGGLPFNLTFENCDTQCGNITIEDDSIVEWTETFSITLINYTNLILEPDTAVISIYDDDVAVIGFNKTTYKVQRSDGVVNVCATVFNPEGVSCPIEFDFLLLIRINERVPEALEFPQNVTTVCKEINITSLPLGEHTVTLMKDENTPRAIEIDSDRRTALINITETPIVGLQHTSRTVDEDDGHVDVCALIINSENCPFQFPFDVRLSTENDTAVAGEHYESVPGILTFDNCERVCVGIPILDDDMVERVTSHTFTIHLNSIDNRTKIDQNAAEGRVVIKDNEEFIKVGLNMSEYYVTEGGENPMICAQIQDPPTSVMCPVDFEFFLAFNSVTDTAEAQQDYVALSEMVGIPPCNRSVCVEATVKDDDILEGTERFFVTLDRGAGMSGRIRIDTNNKSMTIIVLEDEVDKAEVEMERMSYSVTEDEGATVEVCASVKTRNGRCRIQFPFNITGSTRSGTAGSSEDYVASTFTLEFVRCQMKSCVDLPIVNDNVLELDESFHVSLERIQALNNNNKINRINITSAEAEITITDDDGVLIGLEKAEYTVSEDGGSVEVCVVRSCPPTKPGCSVTFPFDVGFETVNDTADNRDYTLPISQMTFDNETRKCINITIIDDTSLERSESFKLNLTRTEGLAEGIQFASTDEAEITISEKDDAMATVSWETTMYTVSEDAGTVEVCAIVLPSGSCPIQFTFDIGLATNGNGGDFVPLSTSLRFSECENRSCAEIEIVFDNEIEDTETFDITLEKTLGLDRRIILGAVDAYVHILDVPKRLVGLSQTEITVSEDAGEVAVCASRLGNTSCLESGFSLNIRFEADSAEQSKDFDAVNGILSFDQCDLEKCINVSIKEDKSVERDESFKIFLEWERDQGMESILYPNSSNGTVTIQDNDMATVGLEKTYYQVSEGTVAEICITVKGDSSDCPIEYPIAFILNATDGIATAPDDYIRNTPVILEFLKCVNTSQCHSIDLLEDDLLERDDTFNVTIEEVSPLDKNRIALGPVNAQVEILDDMSRTVTVSFEKNFYIIDEEHGVVQVCAVIHGASVDNCLVDFDFNIMIITENGTAVSTDDYGKISHSLNFSQCLHKKCQGIIIVDDMTVERNESFVVRLFEPSDTRIILDLSETNVIVIDEDVAIVGFEKDLYLVDKGQSEVNVCVIVNKPVKVANIDLSIYVSHETHKIQGTKVKPITILKGERRGCTKILIGSYEVGVYYYDLTLEAPSNFPWLELNPTHAVIIRSNAIECYESIDCSGNFKVAGSAKECCTSTDTSCSYKMAAGEECLKCIVHGFDKAVYNVMEGSKAVMNFKVNVKGTTEKDLKLALFGTVTSEKVTAELCDYEELSPTEITDSDAEIVLFTINDDIALEFNELIHVIYKPTHEYYVKDLEKKGEFFRDVATVRIMDNDILHINFDQIYYLFGESGDPNPPVNVQYRRTESNFTLKLQSYLLPFDYFYQIQATQEDFKLIDTEITIRPTVDGFDDFDDATTNILELSDLISIVDDEINENNQTFLLSMSLVENYTVCFQHLPYDGQCNDTEGVVEIIIIDDDPMIVGFTQRNNTVPEDGGDYIIDVHAETVSERFHGFDFVVLNTSLNATVRGFPSEEAADAKFGALRDLCLVEEDALLPNETKFFKNLTTTIVNDTLKEGIECFTILITSPDSEDHPDIFRCKQDHEDANDFFCYHTICIDDTAECKAEFEESNYIAYEGVDDAVRVCVSLTCDYSSDARVEVFADKYYEAGFIAKGNYPNISCGYSPNENADYEKPIIGCNGMREEEIDQNRMVCYDQVIYDDEAVEMNETTRLKLKIRDGPHLIEFDDASTIIKIVDDDDTAVVGLEKTFYKVYEEELFVEVCVVVDSPSIDCPIQFSFDFYLWTEDKEAKAGIDYIAYDDAILFEECNKRQCVNISIVNDSIVEKYEHFKVKLMTYAPKVDISRPTAEVRIYSDEVGLIGLAKTSYTVDEDCGSFAVCVEVSGPNKDCPIGFPFQLSLSPLRGTADIDDDYMDFRTRELTFSECDKVQCKEVFIIDDRTVEYQESFDLILERLPGVNSYVEIDPNRTTINILDNDVAIFGMTEACLFYENASIISVCAEQKYPVKGCGVEFPFSVNLTATSRGTAESGKDHSHLCHVVTFEKCSRETCEYIILQGDRMVERDETIHVTLGRTPDLDDRIRLHPTEKEVRILNDDEALMRLEQPEMVTEGVNASVDVCVSIVTPNIECPIDFSFDLRFSTEDVEAESPGDYILKEEDKIVKFDRCNKTACTKVYINDDCYVEDLETFKIKVEVVKSENVHNELSIQPSERQITIKDTDQIMFGFAETSYTVNEDDGRIDLCAKFTGTSSGCRVDFPFEITLETVDDTAESGSDYDPLPTKLSFPRHELSSCVPLNIIDDCTVEKLEERFEVILDTTPGLLSRIKPDEADSVIYIVDDDEAVVGLEYTDYTVIESEECVEICITFAAVGENCHVAYEFSVEFSAFADSAGLGARPDDDFNETAEIVTFSRNDLTKCLKVDIVDDFSVEKQESFFISLERTDNLDDRIRISPFKSRGTVTIEDFDVATVRIESTIITVREDEGVAMVCVIVEDAEYDCPIVFPFEVDFVTNDGNATYLTRYPDYVRQFNNDRSGKSTLSFRECHRRECHNITILEDPRLEETENFFVTIEKGHGVIPRMTFTDVRAEIIIEDVTRAQIAIQQTAYSVPTEGGTVTVCAQVARTSVSCQISFPFSIMIYTEDGTAVGPQDYANTSQLLTFRGCDTRKCVSIRTVSDCIMEDNPDTFFVRLGITSGLNRRINLSTERSVVNIRDDEGGRVILTQTSFTVRENESPVIMCAQFTKYSIRPACPMETVVNINFATLNNTAVTPGDFFLLQDTLSFSTPVHTECRAVFLDNDLQVEPTETFYVSLTTTDSRIYRSPSRATITVLNDDCPEFRVKNTSSELEVAEDVGSARVCIEIAHPAIECPVSFRMSMRVSTVHGDTDSSDYVRKYRETLRFNACQREACFDVRIYDDVRVENSESFNFTVEMSSGLGRECPIEPIIGKVIIHDNDAAAVGFASTLYNVRETSSYVQVCVNVKQPRVSCPIQRPFSVILDTIDVTAVTPQDYEHVSQVVSFPRCDTHECVRIQIVNDLILEGDEIFNVSLTPHVPDVGVDPSYARTTVRIYGDADTVTVGLEQTSYTVTEGLRVEVCAVVYTTSTECIANFPFNISLTTTQSTARDPADYEGVTNAILSFGTCEKKSCLSIATTNGNYEVERNERFSLSLRTVRGQDSRIRISPSSGHVVIKDNDVVEMKIERVIYETTEGEGSLRVCAVMESANTDVDCLIRFPVYAYINSTDHTTVAGLDYGRLNMVRLTFAACRRESCININIINDDRVERQTEQFFIALHPYPGSPAGLRVNSRSRVDILDEDEIYVGLERTVNSVQEAAKSVQVCVFLFNRPTDTYITRRSCPVEFSFSVGIDSSPDTAVTPEDYVMNGSRNLEFEPCSKKECKVVFVDDDDLVEQTESFNVAVDGSLLRFQDSIKTDRRKRGVVNILDNDVAEVHLEQTSYSVNEGNNVELCAVVDSPNGCLITFPFSLSLTHRAGSASSKDYGPVPTEISFNSCDMRMCVDVPTINDDVVENAETFTVTMGIDSTLSRKIKLKSPTATITIHDNDVCAVGLNETAYLVQEDDRHVEICVNANCSATFSFGVDVKFHRDTADPGEDYQALTRRVTFNANDRQLQKCFNGIIYDRATVENTEEFSVSLTRPAGLSDRIKIIEDHGYITIVDDDVAFVGMQRTSYTVREEENPSVGVIVHMPTTACRVEFPFNLRIYTEDVTAVAGEDNDYLAIDDIIRFESCDHIVLYPLTIVHDDVPEPAEIFTVKLERAPDHGTNIDFKMDYESANVTIRAHN